MLTILYFAALRETLGLSQESLPLPEAATVADLIGLLRARGSPWAEALGADKRFRVAVNQDMATSDTPLKVGDEVAIFPPVTGG